MVDIKKEPYSRPWDAEADVVIAGAGGAGLEAALEAASAGAETLVFEKQARIWESSTAISVGRISFAGTDIQKSQGIQDSNELFYRDIMEVGKQKNDPSLVQAYINNQLDTYRQLTDLDIKWADTVAATAGMSVPRGHLTDPLDLVKTLRREAEKRGATIVFQTPVTGLITNEKKRVTGIKVQERTGAMTRIMARKGVILATGGFARDTSRLVNINPKFDKVRATSGLGHTGDGLKMAEDLGAGLRDMEYVKPSFELHINGTTAEDIVLLYLLGGIIVNQRGERFVNESVSYKDTGMACLDQPGAVGYQIIDQKIYDGAVMERRKSGVSSPLGLDAAKIRLLVKGNTIEDLARKISVPPLILWKTIERYNSFVDSGKDPDFGRSTLAGNYGKPVRLDTPPFYSCATVGHLLATYGGIAVDTEMHVLGDQGKIMGLYAAGETVGGFHGASYHSGTALGKALIFGRIAGRNAARSK